MNNEENVYLNKLPINLKSLQELAFNLWYAWHDEALQLFEDLDPSVWVQSGHSPLIMLKLVSAENLLKAAQDQEYIYRLNTVYNIFKIYLQSQNTWYKNNHGMGKNEIAYFCLEYCLHTSLPIYSGGLGVLAGDHLKSASDLDIPLVAIGLFYSEGFFKQTLDVDGNQKEIYQVYEPKNLPLKIAKDLSGKELILQFQIGLDQVFYKVWQVNVGRISLFLLDTNLPQNAGHIKDITKNLYTGDRVKRLQQEILVGIGGISALAELGIEPIVSHMNESHCALLALERISRMMLKHHLNWWEAKDLVKATSIFTTHTPVPAGKECFDPWLAYDFLKDKVQALGITWIEFISLARIKATNNSEVFCMMIFSLKSSFFINGVSKLHGMVSRKMWHYLYPQCTVEEVPIGYITNGAHAKTWLSNELNQLIHQYDQEPPMNNTIECTPWSQVEKIPDKELWQMHYQLKSRLIQYVRAKYASQIRGRHQTFNESMPTDALLNPDFLTIGFSRRFATYKRGDLILKDEQRLKRILNLTNRPIQIIFAGKSHPADQMGKAIIHKIFQFANDSDVKSKIIFLENYDIHIAKYLVQGVDVWLNNPVRPQEASGTSGMKAGMNGVLNFSVLDGWWDEAYSKDIGWEIGGGVEYQDIQCGNEKESAEIYEKLENEIIPLFYNRNELGIPVKWVKMMKQSIINIGSVYNTHRMVSEYYQKYYQIAKQTNERLSQMNFEELKRLCKDEK